MATNSQKQQQRKLKFTPLSMKNEIGDTKTQMAKLQAALLKLKFSEGEVAQARVNFGEIAYREYMTEISFQKNENFSGILLGEFGKKNISVGTPKIPKSKNPKDKKPIENVITGYDILAQAAQNIELGYCPDVIHFF